MLGTLVGTPSGVSKLHELALQRGKLLHYEFIFRENAPPAALTDTICGSLVHKKSLENTNRKQKLLNFKLVRKCK